MNHADVRERLELASAESGGLDRLAAGDTLEAAAVAGHLAGCPACLEELTRLRRSSPIIRDFVVEETQAEEAPVVLPTELRERTLALIREVGVARGPRARTTAPTPVPAPVGLDPVAIPVGAAAPVTDAAQVAEATPAPTSLSAKPIRVVFGRRAAWVASIAAAVVLSVVATSVFIGNQVPDKSSLAEVVRWSAEMAAAPDARHIALTAASTGQGDGDLTIAPTTGALVVVAPGLGAPPSGHEFRCWLQTPTGRTWVGRMSIDEGISYWVGTVPSLAKAPAGSTFGISLEDATGTTIDGPAVLHGTL